MKNDAAANDEITPEQFAQSMANFKRLISAVELQTNMDRPAILESAMAAIVSALIEDLGRVAAAGLLRDIAGNIERQQKPTAH